MDEDWRNIFGILMYLLGVGPGGVTPKGPKVIYTNKVMMHTKSKVTNTVPQCLALGHVWGHQRSNSRI